MVLRYLLHCLPESRQKEGIYNMNKKYKTMQNVGKVKYLVSFHDGVKKT
jgi:hypothetical protein